jgi:hypothetical protein
VARGLPTRLPRRGSDRRPLLHQEPTALPRRLRQTWLEHLPRDKIHDWTDLGQVFVENFQGTYTRRGKQWELHNCKQQLGESLHEYIWRFSKRCTELPSVTHNDAISVFQNGKTCTSLIHQLGCRMPHTTMRATTLMARKRSPRRLLGNSGKPVTLETLSLTKFLRHVFQGQEIHDFRKPGTCEASNSRICEVRES